MKKATEKDFQDIILKDYVYLLRRNLKFLISVISVVVILGLIYSLFQASLYEAKAVVLPPTRETGIGAIGSEFPIVREFTALKGEVSPSQIVIALLNSRSLKEKVVREFNLDSLYKVENMKDAIEELEKRMNTQLKRKTGVIEIRTLSKDPILAAQMANFIIDVAEKMNEELQIFVDKPMLKIIDKAIPPRHKSKPDLKVNLLIAFIIGILIAFGGVTVKTMRDNKIYSLWQVREFFDATGFIVIPKINREKILSGVPISQDIVSPLIAEYISQRKKRFIMVTSPRNKEGKTLVSMQISRIFASLNYNTVLIDLNIENPQIQKLIGNDRKGLMEFLKGDVPLKDIIYPRSEKIPFDTVSLGEKDGSQFVLKEEDISKIKKLNEIYDSVIVDTAGVLESAFFHPLLKEVDDVFFVVFLSKTTDEDLAKCKGILDALQVKRIRVVLNGFNRKIHHLWT